MEIQIIELSTISRIALTADQHLGNHIRMGGTVSSGLNRRCREHSAALGAATDLAVAHDCGLHVGLGDLFDSENPRPQVVDTAQQQCDLIDNAFIVGNHDQNTASIRDHALGPMEPVALIIETPTVMISRHGAIISVPFQSSTHIPIVDWLPAVVRECREALDENEVWASDRMKTDRPVVLAFHAGIEDEHTPKHYISPGSIPVDALTGICVNNGIDIAIAGDWHEHRCWLDGSGTRIVQCGALCPTGFDNITPDAYGSVYVLDFHSKALNRHIVNGPRFHKVRSLNGFDLLIDPDDSHYVEVTCPLANIPDEREALSRLLEDGTITAGEVLPGKEEIEIAAREAAGGAAAAGSVEGAIGAFVDHMLMDPEHEHLRGRVKASALELTKNG